MGVPMSMLQICSTGLGVYLIGCQVHAPVFENMFNVNLNGRGWLLILPASIGIGIGIGIRVVFGGIRGIAG